MTKFVNSKGLPVRKTGKRVYTHSSKAGKVVHANTIDPSEGNKVVSSPGKQMEWKEAAAWVVKNHAGAWKRLED